MKLKVKNKFILLGLIVIALIAVLFTLRFLVGGDEDTWICQNGQWVKHGNPAAPKPERGCGEVACTMEAKQCPDGSYVGRVPPSCEFAPCPVSK